MLKAEPDEGSAGDTAGNMLSLQRTCTQCDQLRQANSSLSASLDTLRREVQTYSQASNNLQARNLQLSMQVAELQCQLRTVNQRLLSVASVAQSMATQGQLLSNLLNNNTELHQQISFPAVSNESCDAVRPEPNDEVLTISDTDNESEEHGEESFSHGDLVPLLPQMPEIKITKEYASEIESLLEAYLTNRSDSGRLDQLIRRIIRALFTVREFRQTSWSGRATAQGPNRLEANPAKKLALVTFLRSAGVSCDNGLLARCYRRITSTERRSAARMSSIESSELI